MERKGKKWENWWNETGDFELYQIVSKCNWVLYTGNTKILHFSKQTINYELVPFQ